MSLKRTTAVVLGIVLALAAGASGQQERPSADWRVPPIVPPERAGKPVIACTPDELGRLRAAWESDGPSRDVVAGVIRRAERALQDDLDFPPRGGQHNQWYQCEPCQMALRTLSDTEHQCPKCEKVYTGEPYDDVIFARKHAANLRQMRDCAWAWAITGEPRFGERARAVLIGYARRYRSYPYHNPYRHEDAHRRSGGGHINAQTLGEASTMTRNIAPAFDLLYDGDLLSDDDRDHIRTGLILPMLENIGRHKRSTSNWQTWHNAAMLWGGAVLGDAAWIERALTDPEHGFAFQMQASVREDGLWHENTWAYHFYTLEAKVAILEGARRLSIDLWSHPRVERMFTLPMKYMMPDGSLPRFGNDVNSRVTGLDGLYEPANAAYGHAAIAAVLRDRPTWEAVLHGREPERSVTLPPPESVVIPSAGHALLRTRGEAGLAAAMTYGPHGGYHGHLDKLSFVFFGHGRELGVDRGRAASQAYRLPIHREWYRTTISHNTVIVDDRPQQEVEGELLAFGANEHFAAVLARSDEAYPGVRHDRLLMMTPEYLLVVDRLTPDDDGEHAYTWAYHNRGTSATCDQGTEPVDLTGADDWRKYLQATRHGPVTAPALVTFADDDLTTRLTLCWPGEGRLLLGDGPGASVMDRVPLAMLDTRAGATWFAATLEPVPDGAEPRIADLTIRTDRDGHPGRIRVTRTDGHDDITLIADSVTVRRGGAIALQTQALGD